MVDSFIGHSLIMIQISTEQTVLSVHTIEHEPYMNLYAENCRTLYHHFWTSTFVIRRMYLGH